MSPHTVFQNLKALEKTRMLIALLIAVALVAIHVGSSKVIATTTASQTTVVLQPTNAPMLNGTFQRIGKTEGDQFDPRTDGGNIVSYSDLSANGSQSWIRYFDLATNTDHLISGDSSRSSNVSGGRIAFEELLDSGAFQSVVFDTVSQTSTVLPGVRLPAISGNLIVSEKKLETETDLELEAYDLNTGSTTRLTDDDLDDSRQQMSPSADTLVWRKCQITQSGCDIYCAIQTSPGVFFTRKLTGPETEDNQPDTDGQTVAYLKTQNNEGEGDIYFQPVRGGQETRLQIPESQTAVRVAGNLIAFASISPGTFFQLDIFVYDISTGILSRVTNTDENELLGDFNISNGIGRIVYSKNSDIYAFTFSVPNPADQQIEDLIDLIESLNLHHATASRLISNLQNALTAIDAGDTATACDSLKAFINQCRTQSGKKLTTNQADQLINEATEIKTALGCQ